MPALQERAPAPLSIECTSEQECSTCSKGILTPTLSLCLGAMAAPAARAQGAAPAITEQEAPRPAPKIASPDAIFSQERSGEMSLTYSRGSKLSRDNPMNVLPVDRALSIYGALADRSETTGARERLSRHLMKMYLEGETDEHRLTVHGLSYLRDLDREIDSRN
jgi:hypothetical protein